MRLSCLARNGQSRVPAIYRGVASPGEESLAAAIAVQAIEAQPAFGEIEPRRGQVLARAEQQRRRARYRSAPQEAPHSRRRNRRRGAQKGGPLVEEQREASALARGHRVGVCQRVQTAPSNCERTPRCRGSCQTTGYPRQSQQRDDRPTSHLGCSSGAQRGAVRDAAGA